MVKTAGSAVAKEALRTGAAIATDVAQGKAIGKAALEHGIKGAENLAEEALEAGAAKVKKRKAQSGKGLGKRPAKSIKRAAHPGKPPVKKRRKAKKQDTFGYY